MKEMKNYTRFCKKCGEAITISSDLEQKLAPSIIDRLDTRIFEHQVNLCKSCKYCLGNCDGKPVFGNCLGNDNVIDCDAYSRRQE